MKKMYASPKLVEYGDITRLTHGLYGTMLCEYTLWSISG